MNENGNKRREWVKTVAIIFLSVLLVLTFFSNTIMNYSLPEVAAQYVESGSITTKIRGNGTVESGDPYNIMIKETRKVTSVAVRVGDQVQKGDVLVYLDESESLELEAAREALKMAQEAYDVALLATDVNMQIVQNSNKDIPTESYRDQITNAQTAVEKAQKDVDDWQQKYDALAKQIALVPASNVDVSEETRVYNEAKAAKESADFALQEAQNWLTAVELQLDYEVEQNTVSSGDAVETDSIANLRVMKTEAELNVISAQTAANNAQLAFDRANAALENKKASGDTSGTIANLTSQQASIQVNLDAANKTLTEKQEELAELSENISKTLNLESLYEAVVKAQELVAKEEAKAIGGTVVAEIAGTVTTINAAAGKEVSAVEPVAVIQPEGQGYTMSFTVTNEQAKRLSVGDVAELVNSWWYDDIAVTLRNIKPDPSNPAQNKLLTFDVNGSVTAGQSLNVSVGQKSANYDMIVPNSAIREDNNGKFVLIVESKSSPLGNRYIATRVDVEILASDDTRSAISGGLEGYEFVITTSNKPVEAGKQVRLAEN